MGAKQLRQAIKNRNGDLIGGWWWIIRVMSTPQSWRLTWIKSKALISCKFTDHLPGSLQVTRMMALASSGSKSQVAQASG